MTNDVPNVVADITNQNPLDIDKGSILLACCSIDISCLAHHYVLPILCVALFALHSPEADFHVLAASAFADVNELIVHDRTSSRSLRTSSVSGTHA